jgi:uncharacterized ferritin-like protein (DUF455 family)
LNSASNPAPQFMAEPPMRDDRFVVRDRWQDCVNLPEGHQQKTLEFLHRQMNEEVDALECSARSICDFREAPWEIRMFLARQCSDEARHALMFRRLYLRRGGVLGEFPVMNFQYRIICGIDSLVARLAVQNRTFEAEGIDAIQYGIGEARKRGDEELAQLFEGQFADEIQHVRVANEFIQQSVKQEPRLALRVAAALYAAHQVFGQVFGEAGSAVFKYLPSEQGRLEAGFAPEEVDVAVRLAERRREPGKPAKTL